MLLFTTHEHGSRVGIPDMVAGFFAHDHQYILDRRVEIIDIIVFFAVNMVRSL